MNRSWIVGTVLFTLSIFSVVLYSSCEKTTTIPSVDKCAGVNCQNGGTCLDGSCTCPIGYAGEFCEKKTNKNYLGRWYVSQTIVNSNDQSRIDDTLGYNIQIIEQPESATKLTIDNLLGNTAIKNVRITTYSKIGAIKQDSMTVEADVLAGANNFVFQRYQPLSGTQTQIVKGEGTMNATNTVISGYFNTTAPHQTLGVINERIDFIAYFIE